MIFSGSLSLPLLTLFPSVCWVVFQAASVLRERKRPQTAPSLAARDLKGLHPPNLTNVSDGSAWVMAPHILSVPTLYQEEAVLR